LAVAAGAYVKSVQQMLAGQFDHDSKAGRSLYAIGDTVKFPLVQR
jgi:hypothetical protein